MDLRVYPFGVCMLIKGCGFHYEGQKDNGFTIWASGYSGDMDWIKKIVSAVAKGFGFWGLEKWGESLMTNSPLLSLFVLICAFLCLGYIAWPFFHGLFDKYPKTKAPMATIIGVLATMLAYSTAEQPIEKNENGKMQQLEEKIERLSSLPPKKEVEIRYRDRIVSEKSVITKEEAAKQEAIKNKLGNLILDGQTIQRKIRQSTENDVSELNESANAWNLKAEKFIFKNLGTRYLARYRIIEKITIYQGRKETRNAWVLIQMGINKLNRFIEELEAE